MRKFLAVVKREYVQRVRTKFFVVATVLGPLFMAAFTILPAMMFGIRSGAPTHLAIVDQHLGLHDQAVVAARKAVELNPYDPVNQEVLDQVEQSTVSSERLTHRL